MRPMNLARATVVTGALLVGGCATAPGTSELSGARYFRATIDTYPVIVTQVDGKSTPLNGRLFVDPGRHELTVQEPFNRTGRVDEQRFALDVRPCTHYYLVAVKANRLLSDFAVRVDYEEPLGACALPGRG